MRLLAILAAILLAAAPAAAAEAPAPGAGDEACLACHGDKSGAAPPVDPAAYALSPHTAAGCRGCHRRLDPAAHPPGDAATAGGGQGEAAPCEACHDEAALSAKAIHGALVRRTRRPACTECHAPHRMRAVRDWKPRVGVSVYCLTCHQQTLEVSLLDGQTLELTIGDAALGASVHLQHDCPDCHADFSKVDHPLRAFTTREKYSLDAGTLCRPCHEEQYRLAERDLHHRLLSLGLLAAPGCPDCHGFHGVEGRLALETLTGTPCRRCHEEVFAAYAQSRHAGAAAPGGHPEAPLCPSCHRVHDMDYASFVTAVNETCRGCHEDAVASHRDWLPRTERHFAAVACPACHSPAPQGSLTVTIIDARTGRPLGPQQVRALVGDTWSAMLDAGETIAPDLAAWGDLVAELNRREGLGRNPYALRIDAAEGTSAHRIGDAADACRSCERCHEACLEISRKAFFPLGIR